MWWLRYCPYEMQRIADVVDGVSTEITRCLNYCNALAVRDAPSCVIEYGVKYAAIVPACIVGF